MYIYISTCVYKCGYRHEDILQLLKSILSRAIAASPLILRIINQLVCWPTKFDSRILWWTEPVSIIVL